MPTPRFMVDTRMIPKVRELREMVCAAVSLHRICPAFGSKRSDQLRRPTTHCSTCGKDSQTPECAECAQWWVDNPPPTD